MSVQAQSTVIFQEVTKDMMTGHVQMAAMVTTEKTGGERNALSLA